MQALKKVNAPFGGVVVVFSGDFRQVLPVVKRGSRAAIVAMTIQKSQLWNKVCILFSPSVHSAIHLRL